MRQTRRPVAGGEQFVRIQLNELGGFFERELVIELSEPRVTFYYDR
jgi:hypothetical protein